MVLIVSAITLVVMAGGSLRQATRTDYLTV